MNLGARQQGEIAYIRGMLGMDEIENRIAALEKKDTYEGPTPEEAHSRGLANLAKLDVYPAVPFSPEGEADPDDMPPPSEHGVVNQDEVVKEDHPAVSANEVDLDGYMDEPAGDPDYDSWSVTQLKERLAMKDLPVSGNKSELVDRLREYDAQ